MIKRFESAVWTGLALLAVWMIVWSQWISFRQPSPIVLYGPHPVKICVLVTSASSSEDTSAFFLQQFLPSFLKTVGSKNSIPKILYEIAYGYQKTGTNIIINRQRYCCVH